MSLLAGLCFERVQEVVAFVWLPSTHNSAHVCGEGDASAGFVLGAAAAAAAQRVPPDDAWGEGAGHQAWHILHRTTGTTGRLILDCVVSQFGINTDVCLL